MRISDWSSDVCSSDLDDRRHPRRVRGRLEDDDAARREREPDLAETRTPRPVPRNDAGDDPHRFVPNAPFADDTAEIDVLKLVIEREIGRASCRERVCKYG